MGYRNHVKVGRGFRFQYSDIREELRKEAESKGWCVQDIAFDWLKKEKVPCVKGKKNFSEVEKESPFRVDQHCYMEYTDNYFIFFTAGIVHTTDYDEEPIRKITYVGDLKFPAKAQTIKEFYESILYSTMFYEYLTGNKDVPPDLYLIREVI